MELIIDIFPVCVISLDHKEMMATKMSWIADSLLLSAQVAFIDSFFISHPCTKRARIFTVIIVAVDTDARLKKIGLESVFLSAYSRSIKPPIALVTPMICNDPMIKMFIVVLSQLSIFRKSIFRINLAIVKMAGMLMIKYVTDFIVASSSLHSSSCQVSV